MTTKPSTFEELLDAFAEAAGDLDYNKYHEDYRVRFAAARSALVSAYKELGAKASGWQDIAESNLAAYNNILPSVSRKLMDINDPEVCRRLAEAECGSEIGVGFETIEPTNDEQQRLAGEMMAQASLGHKRFCVGTHKHEGGELEYEWVDWKEVFARLWRLHD